MITVHSPNCYVISVLLVGLIYYTFLYLCNIKSATGCNPLIHPSHSIQIIYVPGFKSPKPFTSGRNLVCNLNVLTLWHILFIFTEVGSFTDAETITEPAELEVSLKLMCLKIRKPSVVLFEWIIIFKIAYRCWRRCFYLHKTIVILRGLVLGCLIFQYGISPGMKWKHKDYKTVLRLH